MADIIEIKLRPVNDQVKYAGAARENPEVIMDYFPPFGKAEGYTPLELLLISYASCTATALVTMIRGRSEKKLEGIRARAWGEQKENHPKTFAYINLEMEVISPDLTKEEVQHTLDVAEEKICPVANMIKGNVDTKISFKIVKE